MLQIRKIETSRSEERKFGILLVQFPDGDQGSMIAANYCEDEANRLSIYRAGKIEPSVALWILKSAVHYAPNDSFLSDGERLSLLTDILTHIHWRGPLEVSV